VLRVNPAPITKRALLDLFLASGAGPAFVRAKMDSARVNQTFRWIDHALIALAVLIVWGHTASFQFVWDDRLFIVENQSIRSLANLPEMLSRRDAQSSLPEHFILYRPVRTVAYALLHQASGGPEPHATLYHLANVAGHALTAMLLGSVSFGLLQRFGGTPPGSVRLAAVFIGLAFAVHPVVSEVVCWTKSLDDILATFFCLGALSQLAAWRDGQHLRLGTAIALFALAVYSKESAVPFALIPLAYFWLLLGMPLGRSVRLASGFAVTAAVFVVHRHFVLGQTSQTAPISGTYAQTLIDTIPSATTYTRLALGIPPFNIDYAFLDRGRALFSLPVVAGVFVLLAFVATTVMALRSERWRVCGFGLLWAMLFFIPVSNVVPTMQLMAERFIYLPLAGLLIAGGCLLATVRSTMVAVTATCAVIGTWLVVAWQRSWIWHDDLTLFVQTAASGPRNRTMEGNAAATILNLPHIKKVTMTAAASPAEIQIAIRALTTARNAFPDQPALANALGACWAQAHELGKAIECFRDAVTAAPKNLTFCRNLGYTLIEAGRLPNAKLVLEKLLAVHPDDVPMLRMKCQVLISLKEYDEAMPLITRLKQADPESPAYDQWLREIQQTEEVRLKN
jgi:hypothetical protein